jgi:hypothetical protein
VATGYTWTITFLLLTYTDLTKQKINCCGTVRPNRTGMTEYFKSKTLKMKRGDVRVRTSGDMTALVWKDKRDVYILTFTIHQQNVTFVMSGNALKPAIVADYNGYMGYADKGDRMVNSYSISRRTWKWTKKGFSISST